MDPDNLPSADSTSMNFAEGSSKPKAWKEIWGAGQGIGAIKSVEPAGLLVDRIATEYHKTMAKLSA
jgi:nitronate monooxygenase